MHKLSKVWFLVKFKSKCYILYILRHLVFKVLVTLRWHNVSDVKQWALLFYSRMYHIFHLLWARAVFCWMCRLCLTASGTTSSSLCRRVFRKLQCLRKVTLSGSRWEVLQQWPDDTSPNVDTELGLISTFMSSWRLSMTSFESFMCCTHLHT
jgi:hypothetical protein